MFQETNLIKQLNCEQIIRPTEVAYPVAVANSCVLVALDYVMNEHCPQLL